MNLFLAKRLLTTKHQGLITIKVVILWNFNWKTVANFIVHRLLLIPHSFLHSWARLSGRNHPFNFPLIHASVPQLTHVLHTYIQVCTDSKSSFALTYRFYMYSWTKSHWRRNTFIALNTLQTGAGKWLPKQLPWETQKPHPDGESGEAGVSWLLSALYILFLQWCSDSLIPNLSVFSDELQHARHHALGLHDTRVAPPGEHIPAVTQHCDASCSRINPFPFMIKNNVQHAQLCSHYF